jgi:hydroxyethylthiazole kinase-like uncharacterized protein yjeF
VKIFRSKQVKQIDEYTIRDEPVSSINLMERAVNQIYRWFESRFDKSYRIIIFAGPGNNGGDGLALARMLYIKGYKPEIFFVNLSAKTTSDWEINRKRLDNETDIFLINLDNISGFPDVKPGTVIIDAIFGSGLSRVADGLASEVITRINNSEATVISIDIPSGLFGEDNSANNTDAIVKADFTLTFQFPKLSFMFPENEAFTGEWEILPIGLHPDAISRTITPFNYLEKSMVQPLLKVRNKFDHKGRFGHGLLAGGSFGKMGAIVLGAKAALRTGIGLLTCHIPASGNLILQTSVPEAMVVPDYAEKIITEITDTDRYSAVGVGPGMGTDPDSRDAVHKLLGRYHKPLVVDADAVNILSMNLEWMRLLTPGTILTPHPGEFERLAGKTKNGYERLIRQIELSVKYKCIIVLKGAYTSITGSDGNVWFNSTGNPGMATAGSGDVLAGMILSLLSQGYDPLNAAISGVYLHGLAGDFAAAKRGYEAMLSSDLTEEIGSAFSSVRNTD